MTHVRKQFEQRARLAVYLENSDLQRLTAKARSEGKTLVEWAAEMSYQDNNAVESVTADKPADSRALNPANIVNLESADTSPNDAKQFVVDDFLCTMYSPGTNTDERPNASGLYGKQKGV